ncbi:DUF2815 family protein [Gemmobacter lutimaris]|uniref:DUF2815 family protein n=1 Tax=Gemmobacter lutimaris TaxID=2306023 RepID=A0A398BXB9_9RHOB|nr:ssDNA-binding protein [Gemmobacter lutimaris]RID91836.1 DUF2815 family protein [Gemmobacter lutimaris]
MSFKPTFNPQTGRIKALVRLSFFKGFEKTRSFENGSLKYRTNGLLYKNTTEGAASIKVINEGIIDFMRKEFPGKEPAKFKTALDDGPKGRWPLFDGDKYLTEDGDVRSGYADTRYLKLTNDRKFKFRDRRGNEIDDEEILLDLFRSGHWAIAYFHLFPIKSQDKGGNGIFVTCDALQFWKRDEEFAGGDMDDSEFDDYGDDEDDLGSGSSSGGDDDLGI